MRTMKCRECNREFWAQYRPVKHVNLPRTFLCYKHRPKPPAKVKKQREASR